MDAAKAPRRRRPRVAAALSAIGLAAAVAAVAVLSGPAGRPGAEGDAPAASSPAPSPSPSSSPEEPSAPGTAPTADPPQTGPGPVAGASPVPGSEVLDPDAGAATEGVPPLVPDPALVSRPLPGDAAAEGVLVAGFPSDVAGPAEGDTVVSSSVASDADTMQATLTARSEREPAGIRTHFERLWASRGLAPEVTAAADAGGSPDQLTYRTDTAAVTLATRSTGTGTVYSVFAVLRAG